MKNIIDRFFSPKPEFWSSVQKIGLVVTALSAALASAPFTVPAGVLWVLGTAGSVTAILSQLTIDDKKTPEL